MRVIFLDIDGVVNTLMISRTPFESEGLGAIGRNGYYYDLCHPSDGRVSNTQAVLWLNHICHDNNAKIVLSSTWRLGHYEETKECLYNSGLDRDIEIIGRTPSSETHHRGTEIKAYLDAHSEIEDFVILDDDSDMEPFMDKWVHTEVNAGITCTTKIKVADKFDRIEGREYYG